MPAFVLFLLAFPGACLATHRNEDCGSVFCGNLNISHPFRLKNQPRQCGDHRLVLECDGNNRTTLLVREGKFSVQQIFYEYHSMRVAFTSLDTDNCKPLPLITSIQFNSTPEGIDYHFYPPPTIYYYYFGADPLSTIYVVNCTKPIKSSLYIEASSCTTNSNTSSYFYFLDQNTPSSYFNQSCTVEAELPISVDNISGMSTPDIYEKLSEGFLISWHKYQYQNQSRYYHKNKLPFQYV
ncbi:hypothetical protein V6N11_068728 [Hibiscus sabdariffa]|uniref:Wall-associated receptor kinase galacturonan-binding domain-containing protein n=1 Tax=Hibiscus sabdariffa TaxID=183260 RepID=A0ABR2PAY6_9ROSI